MEFFDTESKFYETYLQKYSDCGELVVRANDDDQEAFSNYYSEYEISCSIPDSEKNEQEALADSFMFFVASGVILLGNGCYNINISKVKELKTRYEQKVQKGNVLIKK